MVGLIGYKLAARYSVISETIARVILIGLGLVYIVRNFRSLHHHSHDLKPLDHELGQKKSRWIAILTSLSIAMFLTPCIEIEAYYFQAGTIGWVGIFTVSAIYLLKTLFIMLLLVYLGMNGIKTFKSNFLGTMKKE